MCLGVIGCESKPTAPAAPPPLPVTVISATPTDVPIGGDWVGTLDGEINAQIQPQVSGYLIKQLYKEGASVTKGEVLFEIDPRPFRAVVEQATGQLDEARAQRAQAEAVLGLAKINLNRDGPLAEQHAIAQSQADNDKAQLAQAEANVESAQAAIATAQANVTAAKLNLDFTEVRSLVDGIAGQATTQVGSLVNPQSVLTAVSRLNPIRVYFSISDREYLGLVKREGKEKDLLQSAARLPLTLSLADGDTYPFKGYMTFVDRQINPQTGAIRVAATFPNPGNILRPGQYARVQAQTQVIRGAILVPQKAVEDLQGTDQVYTVGPNNKVHIVSVTLGEQSGNNWIVAAGLRPGVQVIINNLQKLGEGASVEPHPSRGLAIESPASNAVATKEKQ
jgi:membrane fusion protein (multidrug efflux system)